MSVQIKKHTHASKGKRRSHHALRPVALGQCKECGKAKEQHRICRHCNHY